MDTTGRKITTLAVAVVVLATMLAGAAGATATPGTRSGATWEVNGRRGNDIVSVLDSATVAVIPGSRSGPNPGRARLLADYNFAPHAIAGGDLDGDGYGDIVAGDPTHSSNKGAILVLPGGPRGPRYDDRYVLQAPQSTAYSTERRFGAAVAVADLDRDGYDDLITTREYPDTPPATTGRAGVLVVWGGRRNLSFADFDRYSDYWQPESPRGLLLAAGNVSGDGRRELLVVDPGEPGTADQPQGVTGTLWTCMVGAPEGSRPSRYASCTQRDTPGGIADLAVGDVAGSRRDDVVLGQPHGFDGEGAETGGRTWLYRGGRDGVSNPVLLTQDSTGIPGSDEPGDEFAAALVIGDIDRDGKADLVIGAAGEDRGAGRVTVVYGARRGVGRTGARLLDQDTRGIPSAGGAGDRFGAALSLLDVDGDRDLDLVIGAPGESDGRGAITVVQTRNGWPAPRASVRITPTDLPIRYHPPEARPELGRLIGR